MMKSIFKSILGIVPSIILVSILLVLSVATITSCVKNPVAINIVWSIYASLAFIMYIGQLCFAIWLCMKECEDFDERIKALEDKNERL